MTAEQDPVALLRVIESERKRAEKAEARVRELEDERNELAESAAKGVLGYMVAESRAVQAEAERDTLRAYVLYTPCPDCGLPDPTRIGADCEQCAKARAALGEKPE